MLSFVKCFGSNPSAALNRSYHQPVTSHYDREDCRLVEADIVIRPATGAMRGTGFDNRHQAIMEGEKAGLAAIAAIKQRIAEKTAAVVTNR